MKHFTTLILAWSTIVWSIHYFPIYLHKHVSTKSVFQESGLKKASFTDNFTKKTNKTYNYIQKSSLKHSTSQNSPFMAEGFSNTFQSIRSQLFVAMEHFYVARISVMKCSIINWFYFPTFSGSSTKNSERKSLKSLSFI